MPIAAQPGFTSYCDAAVNSTGVGAPISASGSPSIAANDIVLTVDDLPQGQPGLYYYGPDQAQHAFGDGWRCVSGPPGTIERLWPFVHSGPMGFASRALDLGNLPGGGTVTAGQTLNFQLWYRDPAANAAGFNLSDGLSILFGP